VQKKQLKILGLFFVELTRVPLQKGRSLKRRNGAWRTRRKAKTIPATPARVRRAERKAANVCHRTTGGRYRRGTETAKQKYSFNKYTILK